MNDKPSPLKIPELLDCVLQYLSVEDLENCKYVSKFFHRMSTKHLSSNKLIEIFQEDVNPTSPSGTSLEHFLRVVNQKQEDGINLSTHPLQRFKINKWIFPSNLTENSPLIEYRFLDICGSWIRELQLDSCIFSNVSCLENILFVKTPNLKRLEIQNQIFLGAVFKKPLTPMAGIRTQNNLKCLHITYPSRFVSFPISWLEVFHHFPKLEDVMIGFRFMGNEKRREEKINNFLQSVKTVKTMHEYSLPIASLNLIRLNPQGNEYFPKSTQTLLHELRLPLKTFKVDIGFRTDEEDVKNIIHSYASTLQTLVVLRAPILCPPIITDFPIACTMGSLHTLELVGYVSSSLSFLKFTPNLRKLSIMKNSQDFSSRLNYPKYSSPTGCLIRTAEKELSNVQIPSLHEFHYEFEWGNVVNCKLLQDWMPNLEKLTGKFSLEQFSTACGLWKETLTEIRLLVEKNVPDVKAIVEDYPQLKDLRVIASRLNPVGRVELIQLLPLPSPTSCHNYSATSSI